MTTLSWVFMLTAWGIIISILAFCIYKVATIPMEPDE